MAELICPHCGEDFNYGGTVKLVACPKCGEVFDSASGEEYAPEPVTTEPSREVFIQTHTQGAQDPNSPRTFRFYGGGQNGPFVLRYESIGDPGCNRACGCGCMVVLVILALALQGFFSLL